MRELQRISAEIRGELQIKSGEKLCPNCYGMGHIAYLNMEHVNRKASVSSEPPEDGKYPGGKGVFIKRPCGRCRRTGLIVSPAQ